MNLHPGELWLDRLNLLARFVVCGLLVSALFLSWLHLKLAISIVDFESSFENLLHGGDVGSNDLLVQAHNLEQLSILEGGYSDKTALTEAVLLNRRADEVEFGHDVVAASYKKAFGYKPMDSLLAAEYALHSLFASGVTSTSLAAIDTAMRYGRNDYQTMRVLIYIAISQWPKIDCQYRTTLIDLVEHGRDVDDRLMRLWGGRRGYSAMQEYIDDLSRHYDFNIEWARRQVMLC